MLQWIRPEPNVYVPQDGFTIQRPLPLISATGELLPPGFDVQVHLHLESLPGKYKVLPPLSNIIGVTTATRIEIVQAVWGYIKLHGLQDRDDRRKVRNEGPLGQVRASLFPELLSQVVARIFSSGPRSRSQLVLILILTLLVSCVLRARSSLPRSSLHRCPTSCSIKCRR